MSGILVLVIRLGIAALLYGFLGWGLYILWRDVSEKGIGLAGRRVPALNLLVQHKNKQPERRVFTQAEILMGRDPACDLSLNDDAVSARHARMSYHHNQWWVEDLNSTNGTRLNQSPLTTPTVLTTGDQVECGNTALIVNIGGINETSPTIRLT